MPPGSPGMTSPWKACTSLSTYLMPFDKTWVRTDWALPNYQWLLSSAVLIHLSLIYYASNLQRPKSWRWLDSAYLPRNDHISHQTGKPENHWLKHTFIGDINLPSLHRTSHLLQPTFTDCTRTTASLSQGYTQLVNGDKPSCKTHARHNGSERKQIYVMTSCQVMVSWWFGLVVWDSRGAPT